MSASVSYVLEWAKLSFRLERGIVADGRLWRHIELDWGRRWPVANIGQERIYEQDAGPDGMQGPAQAWQVAAYDPRRQAIAAYLAAVSEHFELASARLGAISYRTAADLFPTSLLWTLQFELGSEAYKIEPVSPMVLALLPGPKSPVVCGWLYAAHDAKLRADLGVHPAAATLAALNQAEVELLFDQLQLDLSELAESYAQAVESLASYGM